MRYTIFGIALLRAIIGQEENMNGNKSFMVFVGLLVLFSLCFPVQATIAKTLENQDDITLDDVELHDGVTSDIHLKVFKNEENPDGEIIFAVHGWTHTANTWKSFTKDLFNFYPKVGYVIAIDMPGHGESTVSPSWQFGFLNQDDYVRAIRASLEGLNEMGIYPKTIVAHSQGGLNTIDVQDEMIKEGSSLEKAYGIRNVVLLAPGVPREIEWSYLSAPYFDPVTLANSFLIEGYPVEEIPLVTESGYHFSLPPFVWISFFYTNLNGVVSPEAPSETDVIEKGYNAPEPLVATLQLVGLELTGTDWPPYDTEDFKFNNEIRPSVSPGIFAPGIKTTLQIVCYDEDTLVTKKECIKLYEYLTTQDKGKGFVRVKGTNSVHDLHVCNPEYLLESIKGEVKFT